MSESVELPNLFELASESREEVLSSLGFDFTGLELKWLFIKRMMYNLKIKNIWYFFNTLDQNMM